MHQDFFEELKKDHEEVMGILEQISDLEESEPQQRQELFMQMKQELVPHIRAEEKAFYSMLRKNEESKMDAMEAMEEHHAAEVIMIELGKMSPEEEFWPAKLSVFKEMISHHIDEEESKIFQDAENVISEDEMKSVMENFQQEKERIKQQVMTQSQSK
jgi:hemerythrin-like domain-containing protein